jgi:hypothetical protein
MWGRVVQFVGFVLLVAIVASVVSPWFDLHPTTLRMSKGGVTHYSLAVSLFLTPAPSDSQIVLTTTRAVQLRQGCDIVARDCARLC